MSSSYKLLKTYEFLHKADLDLMKLKDEGIEAYMADQNTVSLAPYYAQAVGGIKIYVPQNDIEQACTIISNDEVADEQLEELFEGKEFEPARRCPNCSSPNIYREQSILLGLFFLLAFFLPVSMSKESYRCVKCNHQWKPE
ncbi:DUF2007 domain-containing protein [Fodinibius salsisoli]|uniref:DUF2007 domain-containing protein n=1 Tax=Fodinibius salsisoli TaxID=2820877 RepID=A0ABT3PSG8_9BACT|nr:DUF2007 domain-containing protein [Fodinibius salsisoli]MCW9708794.1 DUF2007 domain-containing protein [Fodinibius salsisoli]